MRRGVLQYNGSCASNGEAEMKPLAALLLAWPLIHDARDYYGHLPDEENRRCYQGDRNRDLLVNLLCAKSGHISHKEYGHKNKLPANDQGAPCQVSPKPPRSNHNPSSFPRIKLMCRNDRPASRFNLTLWSRC